MSTDMAKAPEGTRFASLTAVVPTWAVSGRVTVCTTTRLGGVSEPPYGGLNLGLHVGDDAANVAENRRLLQDSLALPAVPRWLRQTHSTNLLQVQDGIADASDAEADGAWTTQAGVVLAVLTADCLPVVISDRRGSQIAVVHAGWRGLAAGILENALAVFPDSADVHVWLGPAISQRAFEVGEDVWEAFTRRNPAHAQAFAPGVTRSRFWADLYELARIELSACRAVTVTGGDYCSHRQSNWFHSHRRDGVRSGRMATVAWMASPA